MEEKRRVQLRRAVRYLYDLQKLRISTGNRDTTTQVELEPEDLVFLTASAGKLEGLEKEAEKEIKSLLKGIPIWESWLKDQKGIGPRLGGVLISEFDIHRAPHMSSFWKYAGLAVTDGKADRMTRGKKADYNPWLKAKLIKVMGDSFIKSNSPYKTFYDNYKNRKVNTISEICGSCGGTGKVKSQEKKTKVPKKEKIEESPKDVKCYNCKGTGGPAPWGHGDAHRHLAATRYMCKMFLQFFWEEWRKVEGLPIRMPYAEEYLGRAYHTRPEQPKVYKKDIVTIINNEMS
jgi:hypothetical protein